MRPDEPLRLLTSRLLLREFEADDLEPIHAVFASNPDFLAIRKDSVPGGFSRDSLRSYWDSSRFDQDRHLLVITEQATEATVGLIDYIERSPMDGIAWIGLIIIHHSRQRFGFASEALRAVAGLLAARGHSVLRMAVTEENQACLAFAHAVGFVAYDTALAPSLSLTDEVALMELDLVAS